jgi:hypothetical protein
MQSSEDCDGLCKPAPAVPNQSDAYDEMAERLKALGKMNRTAKISRPATATWGGS